MRKARIYAVLCVFCAFAAGMASPVLAETGLQPFILASRGTGTVEKMIPEVREKLTVAGLVIVGAYEPYKGAQVVVVTNLAPRKMRGLESNGMVLAASAKEGEELTDVVTLTPDKPVPAGSSVS